MYKNRVAITGYGAICPLGNSVPEIWKSIIEYRLGYAKYTHPNKSVTAKFFGRIEQPINVSKFSKKILKSMPRFGRLGLIAADEAIEMAFGQEPLATLDEFYDPFDRGIIFGTGWGGEDTSIANNNSYIKYGVASPVANLECMPSVGTGLMSINWNLRGYQNTPVAACATGNIAIGDAYEIIRSGRAKMMLAGAAESVLDDYNVWTLDVLGALSKEQNDVEKACCPFSADRSGFVLTEGSAAMILENMEDAVRRGANILGEITGYANYSDAYDITAPAVDLKGRIMTIEKAIERAQLKNNDIHYINAHGTSTPLNDANETQAIKEVFQEDAKRIPISSTKSYTGHLVSASGIIESIFCLKTMEDDMVPATVNLKTPDEKLDLDFTPNEHRTVKGIENVLNINYGFGGCNSALVLRRYK
ncbi:beta-ketoacyl-[acyl-carrier-protein] synthase family protein [Pseudoalteromonas piscicida]|uniref:beta-ketoacyl-[acyl-carrier-protein] synthase family protein n=1 Tax=Pseudoalteromonas piscicida TaxID=43662 RepID=UPI001C95F38A|nr:beta-ketoacyl-[acyl-carrier-protein] synthase family protein [Pseudoalteromonas piscicida]QZO13369.1 beta-ketoacyl-[acyl-carrier-protein] synthase family protein [Pseudoalteromonas piscicida]